MGPLPCHLKFGQRLLACHVAVRGKNAAPPLLEFRRCGRSQSEGEAEFGSRRASPASADRVPHMSARNLFSRGQRNIVIALLVAVVVGLVMMLSSPSSRSLPPSPALPDRGGLPCLLFTRSSKSDALEVVTDEEALSVPDDELPFYTVMIPAYNEASVIVKLIQNVAKLDYPTDRLEVFILVEEDDEETLECTETANPPVTVQTGRDSSCRAPHKAEGLELRPDAGPGRSSCRLRRRGHA